jgi:hypothetical protein
MLLSSQITHHGAIALLGDGVGLGKRMLSNHPCRRLKNLLVTAQSAMNL